MADQSDVDVPARTAAMRALSDEDRAAAIAASRNVIGFARFADVVRQRDLSDAYRAPR